MPTIRSLTDVSAWRLCLGCGACAYICPEHVSLIDMPDQGIRPVVMAGSESRCAEALKVCPVVSSEYRLRPQDGASDTFFTEWGPVLELWEGHATDTAIRFQSSSGGALTALAAYCLEQTTMHGVLHIGQDTEQPTRNRTFLSRTRDELLVRAGSRYAPASVCDRLDWVEQAPAPCVVIGRPVEIAALRNAQKLRPQLDANVGVALSFFCAESPSTQGTLALLAKLGVAADALASLRYRGFGWPGHFAPLRKGESEPHHKVPYREAWGFLQAYRPWSVQMWPDGAGELADISCGDPWYEQPDGKNPGFSLVVVRTERGREILRGAVAAGYLALTPAESWKLEQSQSGLLKKKGAVWGRRLAMRLFALPVTRFSGLNLWHCWRQLSLGDKLRSTFGTVRRIITRGLYRRMTPNPDKSVPVPLPSNPKSHNFKTTPAAGDGIAGRSGI